MAGSTGFWASAENCIDTATPAIRPRPTKLVFFSLGPMAVLTGASVLVVLV
jgi:hypothetical protein